MRDYILGSKVDPDSVYALPHIKPASLPLVNNVTIELYIHENILLELQF